MSDSVHPAFTGILNSFSNYPDRIAITDKDDIHYTYAEFYKRISWCQQELIKLGVKKGTRILMAVPMSMELYAMMEATFSLGGIIVFLDPWLKGSQMGQIIKKVKPEILICTHKIRLFSYLLPAAWSIKKWWSFGTIGSSDEPWKINPVSDEDVALITFTGGTGGVPKGADRTFAFLNAQLAALESHMKSKDGTPYVDYTNFPIVGLADFAMGNQVVIPKINLMKIHQANSDMVIKTLTDNKVSRLITSPSLLQKILSGFESGGMVESIKHIVTGGAPIPYKLISTFVDKYAQLYLEVIYGSTEAEPIALTTFDQMIAKMEDPLGGIYGGITTSEIQLRIIRTSKNPMDTTEFEEAELTNGEIGEIVVTGGHVNKSYFENEEAFKETKIRDSNDVVWHRTGDIGYKKEEDLYLVGRIHRIIEREGKEYHPYPLEFALERELNLLDTGYVETAAGNIVLFVGHEEKFDETLVKSAIDRFGYPLDNIVHSKKSLPRDSRHRSKLDVKTLLAEHGG